MKQKKIGTDLWVFDTSAYQITKDTDSSVIYIQGECMKEFKAVNSSTLYPKMKEYNYKTLLAQKPTWGDYIYADEEKQDVNAVWKWGDTGAEIDPPIIVKGINSETDSFECYNIDMEDKVSYDPANYEILDPYIGELKSDSGTLSITGNAIGQTKVKATWPEDSSYKAGSSEIAVKVSPALILSTQRQGNLWIFDGDSIVLSSADDHDCYPFLFQNSFSAGAMVVSNITSSDPAVVEIGLGTGSDGANEINYKGVGRCSVTVEWPEQADVITQGNLPAGSMTFDVSTYAA